MQRRILPAALPAASGDGMKGVLLGLAGVVIFSLSLPASRAAIFDLTPAFVTAARLAGAGVLAALYLAWRRPVLPDRQALWQILGVIAGVVVGFPLFSAIAMETVDASHGGVVLAIMPLATALGAMLLARERPGRRFFLFAVLGSLTVLAFVLRQSEGSIAPGDAWLLLAAIMAAFGYAAGGTLARRMPGIEVIAWALVLSLPATVPAFWLTFPADAGAVGPAAWTGVAYAAIFAQFVGFIFFYRGLALGGIAVIGQLQLFQPYLTIGFGTLLLGETIELSMLIAAGLTILCVWLGRRGATAPAR